MMSESTLRRLQLVGTTLAIVFSLGVLVTRVGAYTTYGAAWAVSRVPYYVNPQNLYVPETDAIAAIRSGASAWSGVANIELVYAGTTSGSSLTYNGMNEVFFRNDSSGYIAEAYWWYDGSGRLLDVDVVFHENFRFYSGNIGCNGDGYYIENTVAHEFGHVLGLGHSSVAVATMWPFSGGCDTSWETLDADDIAGVRSLYPGATKSTPLPPVAPSNLTVLASAADPSGTLALSWLDNATNESGYRVERSADGSSFAQIAQLGPGAVSYADGGLASGATFYYRVDAYNSSGQSGYSNVASGQTSASSTPAPPTAPANPTPRDGATRVATTPTLGWTAASGARYDVFVNGVLTASDLPLASLKIGPLSNATTYSWLVVAKNAAGTTSGPTWVFTTKNGSRK